MGLLGGRFFGVDKATVQIGKELNEDGLWEFEAPVAVMINPASIQVNMSMQAKQKEGVASNETPKDDNCDGEVTPTSITDQNVSMTLQFNVVEQYNEKTKGVAYKALAEAATKIVGKLGLEKNMLVDAAEDALTEAVKKTDFTRLSILNPDICCYYPLFTAAHKQKPVVFYWGNLMYAGFIVSFQTNFQYFSSQGAPLGAEVSMVLKCGIPDEVDLLTRSSKELLGLIKLGGRLLRGQPNG